MTMLYFLINDITDQWDIISQLHLLYLNLKYKLINLIKDT